MSPRKQKSAPAPIESIHSPENRDPLQGVPVFPICLVMLVLGLFLSRFVLLGERAFHHDESIHSYNSWGIVHKGPQSYRYDPVYHGPFLYHFGAAWMRFLPDIDFTARAPFAFMGVLFPLLFLCLRKVMGWGNCLLVAGFLCLSGYQCYFARFAREDVYMLAWLTFIQIGGALYFKTRKLLWLDLAALGLVLSYCTKESSYVNSFLPCSFVVGWGLCRWARFGKEELKNLFTDFFPLIRILVLFGGFSFFVFSYVALDVRVSPETGLVKGLWNILTHSTAISEKTSAAVFARESGFFNGAGRDAVRHFYFQLGFGSTLIVLLVLEGIGIWLRSSRQIAAGLAAFSMTVVFYLYAVNRILKLVEWSQASTAEAYMKGLLWQLLVLLVPLVILALLVLAPGWLRRSEKENTWRDFSAGFLHLAFLLVVALGLYFLLFSSLGMNGRTGPRDGLYAYLSYWFKHQTGDFRIWGTWWYYIPRLLVFDLLPIALIGMIAGRGVVRYSSQAIDWLAGSNRERSQTHEPDRGKRPVVSQVVGSLPPPQGGFWTTVPGPLLGYGIYQGIFLFGIYSILNEKVPWLGSYPSYGINVLGALLAGHWLGSRPFGSSPVFSRLMTLNSAGLVSAASQGLRGARGWFGRLAVTGLLVFLVLFEAGQHLTQVFFRSDYPSELLVYTATTFEFREKIEKIRRYQKEVGKKLRFAVEGKSEWPCVWYLRNEDVRWKSIDLSADIQILDDIPENRRRMQPRRGQIWNIEPCFLRGWWIWHGTQDALPGKLKFWPNVKAILLNQPNDCRRFFPEEMKKEIEPYRLGFRDQVWNYIFRRRIWYPVGGEPVLVCFKTDKQVPMEALEGYLEGSESPPRPVGPVQTLSARGSGPGQFNEPRGLALTPRGELAVADSRNGRVQVLSATGEFRFEFGKGILNPEYSGPSDLACDAAGNFLVTDTWNHCLRKFSPLGELLQTVSEWRAEGNGPPGFFGPRGVAVNSRGEVFMTDTGQKRVCVFGPNLRPLFAFGGPGQAHGLLNEPVGISIDRQDRVYVVDTGNGRIQRFSAAGQYETQFLTFQPMQAEIVGMEPHVDVLPDGKLVTTVSSTGTVWVVDTVKMAAAVYKVRYPNFQQPLGVVSDGGGGFWVSSRNSAAVAHVRVP